MESTKIDPVQVEALLRIAQFGDRGNPASMRAQIVEALRGENLIDLGSENAE